MLISSQNAHKSVMLQEVLKYLSPQDNDIIVDGTFGAGGHTHAILSSSNCRVIGIDRDEIAKKYAQEISDEFGERFSFISGRFGDMEDLLAANDVPSIDGILLDIGVSSMQLDTDARGFSFQNEGPLDMRMGNHGQTAKDVIETVSEEELANIIYKYGDERKSRHIARAIVDIRSKQEINTTVELAEIIKSTVRNSNYKIHPATKTFQALRIFINDELRELERALMAAEKLLSPQGRLVVITFHSGEDTILKQFLRERAGKNDGVSRHVPVPFDDSKHAVTFELLSNKAIKPSKDEVSANKRARSAKMRAAKRIRLC